MPILVTNIRSGLGEAEEVILEKAMQRLGVKRSAVKEAAVSKTTVDARRGRISLVSSVLLQLEGDEEKQAARAADPQITYRREEPLSLSRGMERLSAPIVVAGVRPPGGVFRPPPTGGIRPGRDVCRAPTLGTGVSRGDFRAGEPGREADGISRPVLERRTSESRMQRPVWRGGRWYLFRRKAHDADRGSALRLCFEAFCGVRRAGGNFSQSKTPCGDRPLKRDCPQYPGAHPKKRRTNSF